ncbi:hypothetical protein BCR39DRAFT_538148 [Naematelia encephala]|uniref:Uncharacterized protein n=1 Tax=Naematelia encephala TaxID=71784 RepID=A0A1Y2B035_9TREE|nr:hypothetical protein BCR39DRAFT_538148 [Naematelia encephala]
MTSLPTHSRVILFHLSTTLNNHKTSESKTAMVATRSRGQNQNQNENGATQAGDKRAAPASKKQPASKKAKQEKDGKLELGEDGEVGLKQQGKEEQTEQNGKEVKEGDENDTKVQQDKAEIKRSGQGETTQTGDETGVKDQGSSSGAELDEPKHGTLETGHIYFLYRPKIDADEVESIDDVSKFHILLIPTSAPHKKGHFHRIIEVGKKKLPDPGAKHQVIWGLVGAVGSDRSALKEAFGAYDYDTKTKGRRHQPAARPAARGHYILHSPRDELADSPEHDRQRDFKLLLAYEITTPVHEDFGNVQKELGLEPSGAIVLQIKNPDAPNTNPRAASIPKEKRASYPEKLNGLFHGRRFIPANPPAFLNYQGGELLIISSPHELSDSLGKDGEQVEADLEKDAEKESVGIKEALKELGMTEKDTDIEALEGAWA